MKKRIKSIKKIGLIASSFALSCSVALGVMLMPGNTALADTTATTTTLQVETASLFTSNNTATAILPETTWTGSTGAATSSKKGVHVSAGTDRRELNATFNATVQGDFSIEYVLPDSTWGITAFAISDLKGNEVFYVGRTFRYGGLPVYGGAAFVCVIGGGEDGADTYYTRNSSNKVVECTAAQLSPGGTDSQLDGNVLPAFNNPETSGVLQLAWNGDDINVNLSKYNDEGLFNYATVDGSALKDGYTVSIRNQTAPAGLTGPSGGASSVGILSINGVSFAGTTVNATCDSCDIVYSDTYNPEVSIGGKNEITLDEGNALAPFDVSAKNVRVGSLQVGAIPRAQQITYSEDFTQKTAGTYDITIGNALATKHYSVRVVDPILHSVSSLVIGDEKATVKTAHTQAYDGGSYSGVYVEGTAQLAGTFYGDFEMEYVLPGASWGISAIGVCDLNGNEKFYVGRTWRSGGHDAGSGAAYVYDATANKYYTNLSSEIVELTAIAPKNLCRDILPAYNHPEKAGKLYLQWNGDTIIVKADLLKGGTRALAEIPAAELKNGYKIVLRSQSFADTTVFSVFSGSASPFIVGAVNGTSLAGSKAKISYGADILSYEGAIEDNVIYLPKDGTFDNFTANAYRLFGTDWKESCSPTGIIFTALGDFDIHTAGTYENVVIRPELNNRYGTLKAYDVVVEPSYKVTFDENGGEEIPDWYYSAHTWNKTLPTPVRRYWKFGGWEENGTPFTTLPSQNQRAVSLKAVWIDDVAPIASLNVDAVITRQTGEGLGIAKTDVTAIDAVSGTLTDTAVTVFVKAPNANDYKDYAAFTFNADLYGAYDIRYVVKDGAGNQTVVDRKIYYTATPPTITVSGEVPTSGLTYQTITLPKAEAKVGNTALTYTLSVTLDGKQITVTDHTFKPVKAGTYSLIYAATKSGQTASKEFTVVIQEDTQKPVIEVEFTTTRILLGGKITPTTATATDNVAGSITVNVEIKSGTTVVATGEYTPEKVGVYSVVYTACDEAGNTQTLTFEVLVSEQSQDNHDWTDSAPEDMEDSAGGAGGCRGTVDGTFAAMTTLLIAAIVCITKNKKQTEKGDK